MSMQSDTAARANHCDTPRTDAEEEFKAFGPSKVPADFARALERELTTATNHPSDEVNRRYIVPLQVAYTHAMAQRDQLREALKQLADTLTETHIGADELVPGCPTCDALAKARATISAATK